MSLPDLEMGIEPLLEITPEILNRARVFENHALREQVFQFCRTQVTNEETLLQVIALHPTPVEYFESVMPDVYESFFQGLCENFIEQKNYQMALVMTRFRPRYPLWKIFSSIGILNELEIFHPGFIVENISSIWTVCFARGNVDVIDFIFSNDLFRNAAFTFEEEYFFTFHPFSITAVLRSFPDFFKNLKKYSISCEEESFHELYLHGFGDRVNLCDFSARFIFLNKEILQLEDRIKDTSSIEAAAFLPHLDISDVFAKELIEANISTHSRDFIRMFIDRYPGERRENMIQVYEEAVREELDPRDPQEFEIIRRLLYCISEDFRYSNEVPLEFVLTLPGYVAFSHPEDTYEAWIDRL